MPRERATGNPNPANANPNNQTSRNLDSVNNYVSVGMEIAMAVANDCLEHVRGDKKYEVMTKMKDTMLRYAQMEKDIKHFATAMERLQERVESQRDDEAELDQNKILEEELVRVKASSGRGDADLYEHEKYQELEQHIQDAKELAAMPASSSMENGGEASTSPEERELCIDQEDRAVICPYSGSLMKKPMKNKICAHSYDQESISNYIKTRNKKAKCPVVGCKNKKTIEQKDLVENVELRRYIEQHHRGNRKATA